MVAPGVQEHFLAAWGLLDSFFLRARAPGVAGRGEGPPVLVPGHCFGAEVVEALHELRRLRLEEGEAAREMVQGSPQQH